MKASPFNMPKHAVDHAANVRPLNAEATSVRQSDERAEQVGDRAVAHAG
jgi:hypothetical protein